MYRGAFNDLLNELNILPHWRQIVGKPNPDSRQKDVELILRFFALLDHDKYKKPMKDFLSKFMKNNQHPPNLVLQQFRSLFTATTAAVADSLGDRPFHIRSGLNSAVYDCVMVTIAKNLESLSAELRPRYENLVENQEFLQYVNVGTTDEEVVHSRFQWAEKGLFSK